MLIRKIEMENFMVATKRVVDLPATGITLITGPNGSGKSTIAEAVVTAGWNKSLRKPTSRRTRGFHKKEAGKVTVHTDDDMVITRTCNKSGTLGLEFTVGGGPPTKYTTTTKAQEALEAHVGSYDLWRRSCVFTSGNAANFTDATDAERRELLEDLLDLDQFATAHDIAKKKLKAIAGELTVLQGKHARSEAEHLRLTEHLRDIEEQLVANTAPEPLPEFDLAGARVELAEAFDRIRALQAKREAASQRATFEARRDHAAEQLAALVKPTPPVDQDVEALRAEWKRLDTLVKGLDEDLREAHTEAAEAKRHEDQARYNAKHVKDQCSLLEADQCPTCAQTLPESLKAPLRAKLADAHAQLDAARQAAEAATEAATDQQDEMGAQLADLRRKLQEVRDRGTKAQADRDAYVRAVSDYNVQHESLSRTIADTEGTLASMGVDPFTEVDAATVKELFDRTHELQAVIAKRDSDEASYQREAKGFEQRGATLLQQKARVEEQLAGVTEALEEETAKRDALIAKSEVASAGVDILAPKGVRATILKRALDAIETIANRWMRKFHDKLLLSLTPYSEKARGGMKMAIGLKIVGREEGDEYEDLSNGERRRVDLAMVFALAEVARLAQGVETWGTLFLDEILDAVDPDGADRVCAAIRGIAAERGVVVISHSGAIRDRLQPVQELTLGVP